MNSNLRSLTWRSWVVLVSLSLLCLTTVTEQAFARDEWYRGLDLEQAVGRASLVLVARVANVSETKLMLGGKAERTLLQFQFEPVQVLKGVFSRDTLPLTSDDIGGYRYGSATRHIEAGQVRLLVLERSSQGYAAHPVAPRLDQSLPRLKDPADPLIDAVKVLLSVWENHDRAKKVALLLGGLRSGTGPAAIPLLTALQRRSLLAAQMKDAVPVIAKHLDDSSPAVRETAARTLQSLLEADYLDQKPVRQRSVEAIAASLERMGASAAARVAAIDALAAGGTATTDHRRARALLELTRSPNTFAERSSQVLAVGRLKMKLQKNAVLAWLDELPLDAAPEVQQAVGIALAQLDPNEAGKRLQLQINKKIASGLQVYPEVQAFGELPAAVAVPLLAEVSKLSLDGMEEMALVTVCLKIADPSLVPLLADRLDPREPEIRWQAVEALKKIDTAEAARALQPHLREEADLLRKLEIAEFLGQHGIRDGYAFAIEHMSERSLREQAVSALAAIRHPQAGEDLRKILESSNDPAWKAAAVLALGRIGEESWVPQFLGIVDDLKHPLAVAALGALGDLKEIRAVAKVGEGLRSRNAEMVAASAEAAGKLLALPGAQADNVSDQLATLLADGDASPEARTAALRSLLILNDPRLNLALANAVRDAGLEGSRLMEQIDKHLRERKIALALD
jgi:HEAT repeat protein